MFGFHSSPSWKAVKRGHEHWVYARMGGELRWRQMRLRSATLCRVVYLFMHSCSFKGKIETIHHILNVTPYNNWFIYFWLLDHDGCVFSVYNIKFTPPAILCIMKTQSTPRLQEKGLMVSQWHLLDDMRLILPCTDAALGNAATTNTPMLRTERRQRPEAAVTAVGSQSRSSGRLCEYKPF